VKLSCQGAVGFGVVLMNGDAEIAAAARSV